MAWGVHRSRHYNVKRDKVDIPLRAMGLHLTHMHGKYSILREKDEVFHAFDLRVIIKWIEEQQPKQSG